MAKGNLGLTGLLLASCASAPKPQPDSFPCIENKDTKPIGDGNITSYSIITGINVLPGFRTEFICDTDRDGSVDTVFVEPGEKALGCFPDGVYRKDMLAEWDKSRLRCALNDDKNWRSAQAYFDKTQRNLFYYRRTQNR